ncbi:MAG: DUF2784 domain-containing protein [Candidatus Pseudobacter hemicellulosilyticus]|uniref:DUF2784 domain-containing protein n=1 Tax=Candidatus Pseudobacter hemicellulosilyticus TaxID=3121375 RepID=A0AAJ6BFP3_9BACT|nr:MAG: DUF2784 domain-containing protein [Pseudobacter sp.]
MLVLLDWLLSFLHFAVIGFNLFAWIWPATRKAHLVVAALTLASWFLLGIWYGMGYCPITDWQWRVKEQLGETNLPGSFVAYYAEKIVGPVSSSLINILTVAPFLVAIACSLYLNFRPQQRAVPSSGGSRG